MNAQLHVTFDDLTIAADCGSASNRDWLGEFLVPDFEVRSDGAVDCTVRIVADVSRYLESMANGPGADAPLLDCFALDSSVVRLPILARSGSATTVLDAQFEAVYEIEPDLRRVTIRARPDNVRVRASLLRVVREFAMNHLHHRGLFLHASAIAIGNSGVAFAGHKAAGKTTLLTYLLSTGMGSYLSNDRVYVADGDGSPVLRNMPTVISVRPGTLELCPSFRDRFLASGFDTYLATLDEAAAASAAHIGTNQFGNYFLSPAQFRRVLDAPQQTRAIGSALVFPVIREDIEHFAIRELSKLETLDRMSEALLGAGTWRKGTDAFTIPGSASAPAKEALAARVDRFCSRVRCYELRLGKSAYTDRSLASAVVTLAEGP